MSYSYGECELFLGTSGNAFYKTLWQQASAQGITVLLAAGDSGSAGCDYAGVQGASDGIAVNGLASTPYNISVGGTDFYMPNGGTAYWSSTNNATTQASAKGYIPEAPGTRAAPTPSSAPSRPFPARPPNKSATAALRLPTVCSRSSAPAAAQAPAPSPTAPPPPVAAEATPSPPGRPGTGVPADGVRDTPDVSLFASAGFFGAFYIVCQQSTDSDGQPCSLSGPAYDFAGYGGTSVSSPAFAGVLALVNQKTGSRQGNANYALYNLAGQQAKAGIACNSITGSPAANCVFNDLTTDTTAMPCLKGTLNCTATTSTDRYGVLSGYPSTAGYDLASGLGSVNAANLVNSWANANFVASSATLTLSQSTITHGSPISATVKVSSTPAHLQATSRSTHSRPTDRSRAVPSRTAATPPRSATSPAAPTRFRPTTLATATTPPATPTPSPLPSAPSRAPPHSSRCSTTPPPAPPRPSPAALPTPMAASSSSAPMSPESPGREAPPATSRLPIQAFRSMVAPSDSTQPRTQTLARGLAPGTHLITAIYSGDASFNPSTSAPYIINITRAQTATALQVSAPVLSAASTLTFTALINARGYGAGQLQGYGAAAPSGTVTFSSGNAVLGTALLTQNIYPTVAGDSSCGHLHPSCQPAADCHQHNHSHLHGRRQLRTLHLGVCDGDGHRFHAGRKLNRPYTLRGDRSGRRPLTFTATCPRPQIPQPTGYVTFFSDGQPASASFTTSLRPDPIQHQPHHRPRRSPHHRNLLG